MQEDAGALCPAIVLILLSLTHFLGSLREVNVIGQAWMRKMPSLKVQCGLEDLGEGRIWSPPWFVEGFFSSFLPPKPPHTPWKCPQLTPSLFQTPIACLALLHHPVSLICIIAFSEHFFYGIPIACPIDLLPMAVKCIYTLTSFLNSNFYFQTPARPLLLGIFKAFLTQHVQN